MSGLLRVDGYLLARPDGEAWHAEWCIAKRQGRQGLRFGEAVGALLRPTADRTENNSYFDTLEAAGAEEGYSNLDLAYFQLQEFLPASGEPLDLAASGALSLPCLERLLGALQALGHRPRHILPRALMAACGLPEGRYRVAELSRTCTCLSTLEVHAGAVRLEASETVRDFGFYHVFAAWMELAAEAFATQRRFDIHRNLAANREQLFAQLRRAFDRPSPTVALELDACQVALDTEAFRIRWPERLAEHGAELRLLPPLALPLPPSAAEIPHCPDPMPETYARLVAALPPAESPQRLTMIEQAHGQASP